MQRLANIVARLTRQPGDTGVMVLAWILCLAMALTVVASVVAIALNPHWVGQAFVRYVMTPQSLRVYQDRKANPEAMKASKDGHIALEIDDYASAISHFSAAIQLLGANQPAAAREYAGRGRAYAKLQEIARALADYNTAIRLDPDNSAAFVDRSKLFAERGEFGRALKDMDQALRIFPSAHRYIQRGRVLEQLKRNDEAILSYTKAIESAAAEYERAINSSKDEQHRKTELRYRKHNVTLAYIERANIYRDRRQYDEALADYNAALASDYSVHSVYGNRGRLYEERGEKALALQDYQKAASILPDDEWLKRAIERVR
jgi:tetratricopeptide (TPR) repeat protein